MKKFSLPRLSPSRLVLAVTVAQMASPSALNAMDEIPKEDPHHDRAFRGLVSNNLFSHEHFVVPQGKTEPAHSLKAATIARSARIHEAQMKRYAAADAPTTPPSAPAKPAERSSTLLGSIVYAPVYLVTGPVYLVSGLYNSLPSWRSPSKGAAAVPASSILQPSQPPYSPEALTEKDFFKVKQGVPSSTPALAAVVGAKASASESDKVVITLGALQPSAPLSSPSVSIATVDLESQDFSMRGGAGRPRQRLILSGAGGGVRGYLPALAIEYLESKEGANMPTSDLFDLVAGSSISGIMGLGLVTNNSDGKPCMTGTDLVSLFNIHSEEIFPTTNPWNIPARIWGAVESLRYPQYSSARIESLLREKLGATTTLAGVRTNVLVTALDSSRNMPLTINNIANPECLIWQAARGTSAAPTIYSAFQISSLPGQPFVVDGGLWENSPAFEALLWDRTEARRLSSQPYNPIVLSLETGSPPVNGIPNEAGILNVVSIIDASIQAQVNGTRLSLLKVLKEGETYFNFNPVLPRGVHLADPSADNYRMMSAAFEAQHEVLDRFLEIDEVRLRIEAKGTK